MQYLLGERESKLPRGTEDYRRLEVVNSMSGQRVCVVRPHLLCRGRNRAAD